MMRKATHKVKQLIIGVFALALVLTMMPILTPTRSAAYAAQKYVGKTQAQQTALKDAGAKKSNVSGLKTYLDKEDNEYEVKFTKSGYRYEYSIDAKTGKIEEKEYKIVKIDKKSGKTAITKAKAKSKAIQNAGVKNPRNVEVEKSSYRGTKVWEVEFTKGGVEYEYKINVYSGKILEMGYGLDD